MSYGVNIFSTSGNSTVSGLVTDFVLESFLATSSGSKSYTLSPGETLKADVVLAFTPGTSRAYFVKSVSVSGNTVSWVVDFVEPNTIGLGDFLLITKQVG